MENTKINTGILSFGMSGRIFHAPFIYTNPHFNLTGVVERSKKTAHELYPDIKSYDSVEELLADESIELVIVNTPNYTHLQFAKAAFEAGKHVLLEKPAVETSEQFNELLKHSKEHGKQLFFYQNRRFDSNFLDTKQVIESNELGKLIEVHIRYDRYKLELGQKFFKEDTKYISNGLTYDLGPHLLDQAIALFGKPTKFIKTTSINRPNSQVVDYFNFHLHYPDGLNVYLTSSLLAAAPQPAIVIHGTKGSFVKDMTDVQEQQLINGILPDDPSFGIEPAGLEGKLVTIDTSNQKHESYLVSHKGDYNQLFVAIYDSLRNKRDYPIKAEQIKWQIEMLEA